MKKGDLVRLKSGGPDMVVSGTHWAGDFICTWFDGCKKVTGVFDAAELERVR